MHIFIPQKQDESAYSSVRDLMNVRIQPASAGPWGGGASGGSGAPPARHCTGVGSLPSTCLSGGLVPSTIPEAMRDAARQFADSVAIAEPDGVSSRAGGAPEKLTYQQLHQAVRQVAGGLAVRGIEPGDRVAIWSPNTYHWVLAALGSLYAGATLVPINTRYIGHEALDVVARTKARALFVAGPFLGVDRLELLRKAAGQAALPELIVRIGVESQESTWDDLFARDSS